MRRSEIFGGAEEGRGKSTRPKDKNLGSKIMKKGLKTIPVTLLCVLALVLCLTIAPAMGLDDWQQWRKDEVNSGRSRAEAITGSGGPEVMWEVSGFGTPIAVDGFIYYTRGGSLYKRAYDNDYHNLSFNTTLNLQKDIVYSYIIKTGSYPQIIHAPYKQVTGGNITCTRFEDANGKEYNDWIPAIRLFS